MDFISSSKYGWRHAGILLVMIGIFTIFILSTSDVIIVPSDTLSLKRNNYSSSSPSNNFQNMVINNCECHSMFTVGACGMDRLISMKPKDIIWAKAISGLDRARKKQDIQMMPHLKTLSRYLPQLFTFNITKASEASISVLSDAKLSRATGRLPFLPCQIHLYTPSEVAKCTRQILLDTGQPYRIAFVGDSRVRNTMQQMIRSTLQEMHYVLEGQSEELELSLDFLEQKSKVNLPVAGEGIEIRLHWSAYLELKRNPQDIVQQGARDLLEAWAFGHPGPNDGPIPNIIYITTGLWDTSMLPEDRATEVFISTMQKMTGTLKRLSKRTRVIWHVHGPIKEWLAIRDIPNGALDMMNRASWRWLGGSGVWLWDSHTMLMLREYAECRQLQGSTLMNIVPHSWGCHDFQHAGRDVEDAAANMLWNLACNRVLNLTSEHCCY